MFLNIDVQLCMHVLVLTLQLQPCLGCMGKASFQGEVQLDANRQFLLSSVTRRP